MQFHPYAMAIVNDLFDDDLDAELLAAPFDGEDALAHPAEGEAEASAPERRLQ